MTERNAGAERPHDSADEASGKEPNDGESRDGYGGIRPVPPHVDPEDDETPDTPDDRTINDISAVEECGSCGWDPAAIILTPDGWECYNCGRSP